ncbi:hypothetical protein UY3_13492 [Chelonia mydas]|uniref:Uncharacterized protein n=1 Tax=Chelonia mydas TaxID=8469 RepID=M7AXA1_CHEMY|nr:hypothetical protein UY3_13492 [Chelonia mydas]
MAWQRGNPAKPRSKGKAVAVLTQDWGKGWVQVGSCSDQVFSGPGRALERGPSRPFLRCMWVLRRLGEHGRMRHLPCEPEKEGFSSLAQRALQPGDSQELSPAAPGYQGKLLQPPERGQLEGQ